MVNPLQFSYNLFNQIPIFSPSKVVDTIGAGDAYFAVTVPYAYLGNSMESVGFIGNMAGALNVMSVGNKESISPNELQPFP